MPDALSFPDFFRAATGYEPYPYQVRVAHRRPDFLRIETGLGKTEALVLGWAWRRRRDPSHPRRLIYALPMRSLIEQTTARLTACSERLRAAGMGGLPRIDTVMGGDVDDFWFRYPEEPAIVVGTQDMLLSRALNRGYGMSRFQWPMTFGAINGDAHWVIDEVQLQGIGAVTAAQLQAFREMLGTFGVTFTTFASATLDDTLLETAEYSLVDRITEEIDDSDKAVPRIAAILNASKALNRISTDGQRNFADDILSNHRRGTLTLVILNTVRDAKDALKRLRVDAGDVPCRLLHSQFRPDDRRRHTAALLGTLDQNGPGQIVVSTQVVEAGIDVSATTLFTAVAPVSSLVQRFGRCNRQGKSCDASVYWIDNGEPTERTAMPYAIGEIQEGRKFLQELTGKSVAPANLVTSKLARGKGLVLRKPELLDLFDTSLDLSGHDIDISPYIRETSDFNVELLWRDTPPDSATPIRRDELCPAPISQVREALRELRAGGRSQDIRISNQFSRASATVDTRERSDWIPLHEEMLRPGLQVWLHSSAGWYDPEVGFDRSRADVAPIVPINPVQGPAESCASMNEDPSSEIGVSVSLAKHSRDTYDEAKRLSSSLGLDRPIADVVEWAALWHDVGKAHEVFQETMRANIRDHGTTIWAKSPRGRGGHSRRSFRHELSSALAFLGGNERASERDLIAFLVAAHHGKLRVSPPSAPGTPSELPRAVLGNQNGDVLPLVDLGDGIHSPACTLDLQIFQLGSENGDPTWVDRVIALRDRKDLGLFRLAYLELLVRVADWRASAREMDDVK